jgi:CHAT domain-containing protein
VRHLLVVPDGPLQSLPYSVLVTGPVPAPVRGAEALRALGWLAKRYALTVLPSVSSLRALRTLAPPSRARQPFAGFGAPRLAGPAGAGGPGQLVRVYTRGGEVDVEAVRALPALPESAGELQRIAKALGAPAEALHLGAAASETTVRSLDLRRFRTVAFATHALMAGEFRGLGEPALVLTPPERPAGDDDGLLTAGEIARLGLDADWVVLSACNTAAPDGTPGAEGLSGLARAFFYAGTRSLLVSHWAVSSEAAVSVTTGLFEALAADPGIGRAEALRRAELALLADPERPELAHPAFWAPFVVVGEGGAAPGRISG